MTPWLSDPDLRLYHGDALEVLRELPDRSVHMCATSPPFYGLRNYDVDGQIGLEDSPDEWVARLVDVFREVKRVLRDDGVLFVEIGDSYLSAQGGRQSNAGEMRVESTKQAVNAPWNGQKGDTTKVIPTRDSGLKPKDLLGQPWLLAKALRDPYYTGKIKSEADRVWLAAIIDGEGSINIHRRKAGTSSYSRFDKADGTTVEYQRTKDSYQPKLEISNTNLAIIERVVAITGMGHANTKQLAGTFGRKQTIYRWCVTADKARDVLREVYPHLVGKQHEARLALGCPSSGDQAAAAHEALKRLHQGEDAQGIDFREPESMWEAGWYLRSEIIWSRLGPNPMPESVTDRPTKSHSTIFLLSKRPRYYFDQDAIRESYSPASASGQRTTAHYDTAARYGAGNGGNGGLDGLAAKMRSTVPPPQHETLDGSAGESPRGPDGRRVTAVKGQENSEQHRDGERWPNPTGANARSVWTIPTQPTPFAHFATWPRKLVARMILAGTSERGCCPECGAPWVRETDGASFNHQEFRERPNKHDVLGGTHGKAGRGPRQNFGHAISTTLGWSPSCAHAHAPVPAVVLDPFAGSGTTLLVARQHGRHSVGIELNEDYCQLVADRTRQQSLLADGAA